MGCAQRNVKRDTVASRLRQEAITADTMTNLAQQESSTPARVDAVRRDRDRFLAFAFCAADILIELDKKCRISYIAGATLAVTGKSDAQLLGQPFAGMVAPVDRTLFNELLGGLKPGMRLDPVRIRFS